MEIKDIQNLIEKCMTDTEDDSLIVEYKESLSDYISENKVNDEIISIIVKGVDIDRAVTLFDYLESIQKNEIAETWKLIKKNTVFKSNPGNNSIKILSGMISLVLINTENLVSIAAGIFSSYIDFITSEKKPVADSVYRNILIDYCLTDLPKNNFKYAVWKDLKVSPKIAKEFIEIVLELLAHEDCFKDSVGLKKWAELSNQEISELIEHERIESKIPKSRIDELKALVEHYANVEKAARDSVYREEELCKSIEELNIRIDLLLKQKADLEAQVRNLNNSMNEQRKYLAEADKEITERKNLNDAFDALKKNDEGALLRDIANELRAEYSDFMDSENDEMDIQLGEIYKEKIRNIFRILAKKGVKVD